MLSRNNVNNRMISDAKKVPHYGLRKLSVGVASVLLSTTLYFGATAHADVNVPTTTPQTPAAQTDKQDSSASSAVTLRSQPTQSSAAQSASQQADRSQTAKSQSVTAKADQPVINRGGATNKL